MAPCFFRTHYHFVLTKYSHVLRNEQKTQMITICTRSHVWCASGLRVCDRPLVSLTELISSAFVCVCMRVRFLSDRVQSGRQRAQVWGTRRPPVRVFGSAGVLGLLCPCRDDEKVAAPAENATPHLTRRALNPRDLIITRSMPISGSAAGAAVNARGVQGNGTLASVFNPSLIYPPMWCRKAETY